MNKTKLSNPINKLFNDKIILIKKTNQLMSVMMLVHKFKMKALSEQ